MAQSKDHYRGERTIVVEEEGANKTIILFHGYSGSSNDFGELPNYLATTLHARVVVPLLPGHGTRVEDLLPFELDDFLNAANAAIVEAKASGRPFALGGYSFGGHLAMLAGSASDPVAIFTAVIPFSLRFPFHLSWIEPLAYVKKIWKKRISKDERAARAGAFFYSRMPGKALRLLHEGNRRIVSECANIACPILTLHTKHDLFAYPESGRESARCTASNKQRHVIVEDGRHALFLSNNHRKIFMGTIAEFFTEAFQKENTHEH